MFGKKKNNKNDNNDSNGADKREFERIDFVQSTYFKVLEDKTGSSVDECFINNISIGGISFDIKTDSLKKDDEVMVVYKIRKEVRRDRLVVRHIRKVFNNHRCGCQFIEQNKERNEIIKNYIKENNL